VPARLPRPNVIGGDHAAAIAEIQTGKLPEIDDHNFLFSKATGFNKMHPLKVAV
jgi:hypothetical protein